MLRFARRIHQRSFFIKTVQQSLVFNQIKMFFLEVKKLIEFVRSNLVHLKSHSLDITQIVLHIIYSLFVERQMLLGSLRFGTKIAFRLIDLDLVLLSFSLVVSDNFFNIWDNFGISSLLILKMLQCHTFLGFNHFKRVLIYLFNFLLLLLVN